ncbi:MAG TPA: transglutaminase family protein [Opitutaceae bacterium]|nr:transglutaminase family protein [Opitutaceae bacterium]
MLISLLHRTTFVYAGKAHESFNEVRLRPLDDASQTCRSFELRTEPAAKPREYVDFYGNTVHFFDIAAEHSRLVIEANSEVETTPNGARPPVPAVSFSELRASPEIELHAEFLTDSHYVPLDVELWREAQDALGDSRSDVWSDVQRMCQHIYKSFAYKPRTTGVGTGATDALRLRSGVCQDFAHVALGLCRSSGIPARYVSGYFIKSQRRPNEDEASHAWIEAFIPGYGWAAFDPTHDRPADDRYIKLASGRDYADIRPVSGTYRGGKTRSLNVEVRVREAEAADTAC